MHDINEQVRQQRPSQPTGHRDETVSLSSPILLNMGSGFIPWTASMAAPASSPGVAMTSTSLQSHNNSSGHASSWTGWHQHPGFQGLGLIGSGPGVGSGSLVDLEDSEGEIPSLPSNVCNACDMTINAPWSLPPPPLRIIGIFARPKRWRFVTTR